jgi:addiction module HigA family antidote
MARSAIHPGEHLAEAIEAIGSTAAQVARDISVPPNRITSILHGTRGITADTALRLGRYFGTSPAFWMNLQQIYDLRRAEQEIGARLARIPVAPSLRRVAASRQGTGDTAHRQRTAG